MTSEKFKASVKKNVDWGRKCLVILGKALLAIFLMLFPLAFLQEAMSKHWAWSIPLIAFFIFAVYLSIHDFRHQRLETQQGIQAFAGVLLLTILVFSVLSFICFKFGYAGYQGFRTRSLLNESWSTTLNFVEFYTWQLFDVIPLLKINEALGWSAPLSKYGFVSGVLTLGFRATIILVLLKEFSRWWNKRKDQKKSTNEVILKNFENPVETRIFTKGKFEVVQIAGMTLGKATYEPGWKWSTDVGPTSGAALCDVEHLGLVISGQAMAAFQDGRNVELSPGSLFYIPPVPHDSWVIGDERYVSLHFMGAENYTK